MRNQLLSWPPQHSVRRSSRAKYASLKISSRHGLEVILPMHFPLAQALNLLNEKRAWIEKNAVLLDQPAQRHTVHELPQDVHLLCAGECWKINYLFSPTKTQVILRPQQELMVLGNIDDKPVCIEVLHRWIQQKAEQILTPRLHALSQELNLPFKRLTIRSQKTRWGSCSSQKAINLNFKLIFFSPEIVRYIMIHELCHTVHMNHSRKFWQLVARHDPEWQTYRRLSRRIDNCLPLWINN